ncbi:sigma-54 interaction domain-containing protein [Alkalihalophilus marmarensis]|uniref:sigma-54 interaction domain-containing protein n=1 Tax=Alkalihalophilus marmarensis TaxID=521377 RepID=UPI002DBFD582|nr:sigma 54-interacting transcriptional regulator [Alkalihalophilus marmarensis]MEC2072741.1 sigma 54-interacting transcriptional regulator [Alkalihalophilus marmarensis]
MIVLYKVDEMYVDELAALFEKEKIKVQYFSSLNSLLDQVMNPMIIVTPAIYKKELEHIPLPIIPIMITSWDIQEYVNQSKKTSYKVIGTQDEIDWLKRSDSASSFVLLKDASSIAIDDSTAYIAPIWLKKELVHIPLQHLNFVTPGKAVLINIVQIAASMLTFTEEVIRDRYQVDAILDSDHDGIVTVDKDGIIKLVNQHAKRILGLDNHSIGQNITSYIPDSDMLRVLKTGVLEMGDLATVHGRKLVINRYPIKIGKKVIGAVSNFKEITDIQKAELKLRRRLHENGLETVYSLEDIVGRSSIIHSTKKLALKYAATDSTVLITGESGTGKELFAQGIHASSRRSYGPFVGINCSALSENLLESELFGYVEGTFTGALKGGKQGLFELAHGGTLFLDEIGEIPQRIQTLLLRVIQEKTVRRVGGDKIIPVDVRIIAATNRELELEIKEQRFRADLYYRLNVLALDIPPLRERLDDIPDIVEMFMSEFNKERGSMILEVEEGVYRKLKEYEWPGNIRELRNVVERMVVLEEGSVLKEDNPFIPFMEEREVARQAGLKENEQHLIVHALEKYDNNRVLAARSLGIDRTTLWRKIKKYNL